MQAQDGQRRYLVLTELDAPRHRAQCACACRHGVRQAVSRSRTAPAGRTAAATTGPGHDAWRHAGHQRRGARNEVSLPLVHRLRARALRTRQNASDALACSLKVRVPCSHECVQAHWHHAVCCEHLHGCRPAPLSTGRMARPGSCLCLLAPASVCWPGPRCHAHLALPFSLPNCGLSRATPPFNTQLHPASQLHCST